MKSKISLALLLFAFIFTANAQENEEAGASYVGTVGSMRIVPSLASRTTLNPAIPLTEEPKDGRSSRNKVIIGKDKQTEDDYFFRNQDPLTQKLQGKAPSLVFDLNNTVGPPSDPSLGVGPNHVFMVYNTGFMIYDKAGTDLTGPLNVNNIFSNGGCCDLTVSYDNAADRWVVSYLFVGAGAEIAVSDGPDPITASWYLYSIPQINDYQKLSVWSDGYYITDNTSSSNKVWALERDEMLAGNAAAGIQGFDLTGIATSGFYSPQALNVSDGNMPAAGSAPIIYLQDDAWGGVATDHIKIWTIDVDWATPGNSTISAPNELVTTPYISVFDGGSFSNLTQPGGGTPIDALQATIMNQAQFRKFAGHNSAVFNFVIDVDATAGEHAGIRWYELRQAGDGQPWSIFQEGTYTAPGDKHAWHASMMMDVQGNIGMGYSGMTIDPNDPNPIQVSSYYTGRFAADPINTMTIAEELIANGNQNIPGFRYGDYSKIDVDPNDDKTFWFINEYMNNGGANVVGVFKIAPNFNNDLGAVNLDNPVTGTLTNAETVTVTIFNYGQLDASGFNVTYQIDGGPVVSEPYVGTIPTSTSAQFTFAATADLSTVGQTYSITVGTVYAADEDNANDEITVDVTHLQPNDLGVVSISSPTSGVGLTNAEQITVEINNFGGATQSNFDVTYNLDGSDVTEVVAGPLPGNTSMSYTFTQTGDFSALGSYNLSATTSLGGDSDTSNDETSVVVVNSNCQPTADCSLGDGFQLFSVANINNPSACEGYGDFTNLVANMEQDTTYDLTVTTGYGDQFVTVWIDFNDDFVFTTDEVVVDNYEIADGQAGGSYTETMDLVIPAGAALGQHIMRAKTNWDAPVPADACEETQYGETEDYSASIGTLGVNDNVLADADFTVIETGNNIFDVTLSNTSYDDKLELQVYNVLGQRLLYYRLEKENDSYNYQLDMSYASSGVYLVKLGTANGGKVKRIVVK